MRQMAKVLLCVLLVISLTLSFCACGKKLTGTYVLTKVSYEDGTVIEGKTLAEEMREFWGMEPSDNYITLNKDGTGILCVYGYEQEIGYQDGKFWYLMELDSGLFFEEEIVEYDEEGFPIIDDTPTEETEPSIPEEIMHDFTVSGKTITLDPEGFGEIMTFTKR